MRHQRASSVNVHSREPVSAKVQQTAPILNQQGLYFQGKPGNTATSVVLHKKPPKDENKHDHKFLPFSE